MSNSNRVIVIQKNLQKYKAPAPAPRLQYGSQSKSTRTESGNGPAKRSTQAAPRSSFDDIEGGGGEGERERSGSGKKVTIRVGRKKAPPRAKLTQEMLKGESGVDRLVQEFKGMKFSKECDWRAQEENLHKLLHKYETWGRRLVPQMSFEEFISSLEKLASKRDFRMRVNDVSAGLSFVYDKEVREELDAGDKMRSLEREKEVYHEENRNDKNGDGGDDVVVASEPPKKKALTEEDRQRIEMNRQKARERRMARERERQQAKQDELDHDIELQIQIEQEKEQEREQEQKIS